MSKEKKPRLSFRAEELAVPEVCTGEVPQAGELTAEDAGEQAEIQYDTVAIPEIHLGKPKQK